MMLKKITYLFILSLLLNEAAGQDIQFSQYYAAPMYLNPAFTGANVCMRMTGNYRNQWPGTGKGYVSQILGLDHFDVNHSMGYGFMIMNDKAGTGNLHTLGFTGSFAYEANINRQFAVRMGLQAGMVTRSIDMSKLLFSDQISKGGANIPTSEVINPRVTYPDFNTGALGYGKDYWVGAALHHMFKPGESLMDGSAMLPRKFSLHGGKKFYLNKEEDKPEDEDTWTIMPTANYKHQAKYDQLDVGCYFAKQKVTFGLWYRGIPGIKAYRAGYPNNDAMVFLAGFAADKLHIGYSYDVTISWLSMRSYGAHELSISYQPCTLKPKKKKSPVVSCPKF